MSGGIAGAGDRMLELLGLVHDIARMCGGAACGSSSATAIAADAMFRKDSIDLVRRISLLSHLFEEIKDLKAVDSAESDASTSSTGSATSWSSDLVLALHSAKRLLFVARNFRSNCTSDGAAKTIVFQFQCVTWKLEKLLSNLPYDQLDISEEVREQVELVRTQLNRAAERYGSIISNKSSYDLSQPLAQNISQVISKSMKRLHKQNSCPENLSKLDSIPKSNGWRSCSTNCASLNLERARSIPASSEFSTLNVIHPENLNSERKSLMEFKKPEAIIIPEDFLCPISLELMRDPVIVATGQTYERSYIQRWIDGGNATCPKTQQKLQNLTLTPNYVLRSLITQWCIDNNIEQPTGLTHGKLKRSDGSFRDVTDDIAAIETLVRKLSSQSIEERRAAVTEIRSLSKRSTDNRILIAEAGAIPVLVNLLTSEDVLTQENAVTSILNLSIYENNKGLIMLAGAIPSIVQVLRAGSMEARENAAATLFSLSLADENKIIIGSSGGAIPALVELLQNGSPRGKKDAATALFNLCIYQGNKGRAIRAGIITALLKMLTDSSKSMVDEALTIMSVLASHQEAKIAIVKAGTIPVLIDLLRTGLPRNKENTAAILLALCKRDTDNLTCISRLGAVIPLTELARSGTERAKRKATSLLEHLRKFEQLLTV